MALLLIQRQPLQQSIISILWYIIYVWIWITILSQGGEAYRLWFLWFHFLLWQPPALLWLFTGEYAHHFSLSLSTLSLSLSILTNTFASLTIHGWISYHFLWHVYFAIFVVYIFYGWIGNVPIVPGVFFQTKKNAHTDKISQLCWRENFTIQQCDILLSLIFNEKYSLTVIILSVFSL